MCAHEGYGIKEFQLKRLFLDECVGIIAVRKLSCHATRALLRHLSLFFPYLMHAQGIRLICQLVVFFVIQEIIDCRAAERT